MAGERGVVLDMHRRRSPPRRRRTPSLRSGLLKRPTVAATLSLRGGGRLVRFPDPLHDPSGTVTRFCACEGGSEANHPKQYTYYGKEGVVGRRASLRQRCASFGWLARPAQEMPQRCRIAGLNVPCPEAGPTDGRPASPSGPWLAVGHPCRAPPGVGSTPLPRGA